MNTEPATKPTTKTAARSGSKGRSARGGPQPPNWSRVLKRRALFAPIFLATVMLLGRGSLTLAGAIVQTIFLLAIFIPFSYFMDRLVWRSHEKRLQKPRPAGRCRSRGATPRPGLRGRLAVEVVPGAGPRCEDQKKPSAALARHR